MAFVMAARFRTPKRAQAIYRQIERALYHGEPSDISVYNLILDNVPHVVVLGERPPTQMQEQVTRLLESGQVTDVPADVVATLRRRREQERGRGRWVAGHYRPGLRLRVEPTNPDQG